jgi:hypothetical protein
MAYQLNAKFFRKSVKVNRAIEITDTEAVIPAVKDSPEIRVPLPNRRLKTREERDQELLEREGRIAALELEIETERKTLLSLVKAFGAAGSGAAEVVVQNLKIKGLMQQRTAISRPDVWIEEIKGLTLKDVFESKRDIRKIGSEVYQMKRRVEPIASLHIDLAAAADAAAVAAAEAEAQQAEAVMAREAAAAIAATAAPIPRTAKAAAQGAIIGRRVIKVKNPSGPPGL